MSEDPRHLHRRFQDRSGRPDRSERDVMEASPSNVRDLPDRYLCATCKNAMRVKVTAGSSGTHFWCKVVGDRIGLAGVGECSEHEPEK
jgi:hypothetical protein